MNTVAKPGVMVGIIDQVSPGNSCKRVGNIRQEFLSIPSQKI